MKTVYMMLAVLAVALGACSDSTAPASRGHATFELLSTHVSRFTGDAFGFYSGMDATFNIRVTAVDGDVVIGMQNSYNPTFDFAVYKDGVRVIPDVSTASSFDKPVEAAAIGNSMLLIPGGVSVIIPVTYSFLSVTRSGTFIPLGHYTVGIKAIRWLSRGTDESHIDTSMSNDLKWQTTFQILP